MASKSICSRCLRLAASSASRPFFNGTAAQAFVASTQVTRSRRRQIHQSTRHGRPEVEARTNPPEEIPAYSTLRGRQNERVRHEEQQPRLLLQPNNLIHSFSNSPSPEIRRRAAVMRQNAYCPHPSHQATRTPTSPHDAETRKTGAKPPAHVRYECPDCRIPVSCCEEHFAADYESHLEICDQLREINEDDHDLVSGRFFPEFEYPGPQMDEAQVNMTNWDTMLYSREFDAVNEERGMRQVTRLLTYPITIGSVLHELSPYHLKNRLTAEGLRSLSGKTIPPLSI